MAMKMPAISRNKCSMQPWQKSKLSLTANSLFSVKIFRLLRARETDLEDSLAKFNLRGARSLMISDEIRVNYLNRYVTCKDSLIK